MTDPLGQSQVLPYLIGLGKKEDYKFFIVSLDKHDNFKIQKDEIKKICNENNIAWHPVFFDNKIPGVSFLKNYYLIIKECSSIIKNNNVAMIHARAYIPALVALYFKKKKRIPFLFDMRGFFADERVDGGHWPQTKIHYKTIYSYFKKKEKELFGKASHIISLTLNGKQSMVSNFKINEEKISVIPCCADLNHFNPKNTSHHRIEALKKQLKISSENYVLIYLGSIGTWYLSEEMFKFFNALKSFNQQAIFLVITTEKPEKVWEYAEKCKTEKDSVRVYKAKRAEVPDLLMLSDSSIFFIKPSYSKKASSPTKLGEILGIGLPVVCNANVGDVDYIISKSQTGVIVKEFSDEALSVAAHDLMKMKKGENIREKAKIVEDFFSLDLGIEKYKRAYDIVLK